MLKMKKLIPSSIPQSGTWFLPEAISSSGHLGWDGLIADRPADEVGGDPTGTRLDFQPLNGHRPPSRVFLREGIKALASEVDASPP